MENKKMLTLRTDYFQAYNSGQPWLITGPPDILTIPEIKTVTRGNKFYELNNHLGNVIAIVSDMHIPKDDATYDMNGSFVSNVPDGITDYFQADVTQINDYFPFGSLLPGRNFNANQYRFGFGGQEKDDEVFGSTGSFLSFKYRGYDSRVVRFWSVDPLAKDYPELSTYQFAGLTPIWAKELEGFEPAYTNNGVNISASDRLFNGHPEYNSPEKSAIIMKQTAASIEHYNKFKPQSQGFIKQGKSEYQKAWENSTPQWTQDWIKTDPVIKSIAVTGVIVTGAAVLPSVISGVKNAYDGGQLLYMTIQGSEGVLGGAVGVGLGATEYLINAPANMPSSSNPIIQGTREMTNAGLQLIEKSVSEIKQTIKKDDEKQSTENKSE